MTYQPKVYRSQGGNAITILVEDGGVLTLGNDVVFLTKAGAPTDGTSGTGAALAGPGSICIDRTNAKAYINTNTKASPLWTVMGAQTT